MAIMAQEDLINKIESKTVNDEAEVLAIKSHEDKIAVIKRDAAIRVAAQASDANQRKIQVFCYYFLPFIFIKISIF